MDYNVFMVSDASYSATSQTAGLGVADLCSNQTHMKCLKDIKNTQEAELEALKYAISIALINEYKDVVFVYDNISLPVHELQSAIKNRFNSVQFLWLKRVYLQRADLLSKKARVLQEKFIKKSSSKVDIIDFGIKYELSDIAIINNFKKEPPLRVLKYAMLIASDTQKELLKEYIKDGSTNSLKRELRSKDIKFFRFIYCLINQKDERERFFKFIQNVSFTQIKPNNFKEMLKKESLMARLEKIIEVLQKNKRAKNE